MKCVELAKMRKEKYDLCIMSCNVSEYLVIGLNEYSPNDAIVFSG